MNAISDIRPGVSSSLSLFKQTRLVLFRGTWHKWRGLWHCFHCFVSSQLLWKPCVALEVHPREEQNSETLMALFELRGVGFNRYFGIYWKAFKLNQRLHIKWDYEVGILLMVNCTAGRKLSQWSINMYLLWLAADDSKKLFLEAYMFELQNQFFGPRLFFLCSFSVVCFKIESQTCKNI